MLSDELVAGLFSLRPPGEGDSPSAEEISAAEQELGVTFPDRYRDFIGVFG